MAIKAIVETRFGEEREVYIRLNSVEASNHGQASSALFRGFLSEQAYLDGKMYVWESSCELFLDVGQPIWDQAYGHLKSLPEFSGAVDL